MNLKRKAGACDRSGVYSKTNFMKKQMQPFSTDDISTTGLESDQSIIRIAVIPTRSSGRFDLKRLVPGGNEENV